MNEDNFCNKCTELNDYLVNAGIEHEAFCMLQDQYELGEQERLTVSQAITAFNTIHIFGDDCEVSRQALSDFLETATAKQRVVFANHGYKLLEKNPYVDKSATTLFLNSLLP